MSTTDFVINTQGLSKAYNGVQVFKSLLCTSCCLLRWQSGVSIWVGFDSSRLAAFCG